MARAQTPNGRALPELGPEAPDAPTGGGAVARSVRRRMESASAPSAVVQQSSPPITPEIGAGFCSEEHKQRTRLCATEQSCGEADVIVVQWAEQQRNVTTTSLLSTSAPRRFSAPPDSPRRSCATRATR